jgi:hypothetical protein
MEIWTFVCLALMVVGFFAGAWEAYWLTAVALIGAFSFSNLTFQGTWAFIAANPGIVVGCGILFLAVGVVWSFFKWYRFVKTAAEHAKERLELEVTMYRPNAGFSYKVDTEEGRQQFMNNAKPWVSRYKARIAGWIAFWPLSMLWTVLTELLRDVFERIVEFFKGHYQRIVDKAFQAV